MAFSLLSISTAHWVRTFLDQLSKIIFRVFPPVVLEEFNEYKYKYKPMVSHGIKPIPDTSIVIEASLVPFKIHL